MEETLKDYISWPQFIGVMFFYTFLIVGIVFVFKEKEEE
jgi:cbb3-type cytochrome oxidase subunit 3